MKQTAARNTLRQDSDPPVSLPVRSQPRVSYRQHNLADVIGSCLPELRDLAALPGTDIFLVDGDGSSEYV